MSKSIIMLLMSMRACMMNMNVYEKRELFRIYNNLKLNLCVHDLILLVNLFPSFVFSSIHLNL